MSQSIQRCRLVVALRVGGLRCGACPYHEQALLFINRTRSLFVGKPLDRYGSIYCNIVDCGTPVTFRTSFIEAGDLGQLVCAFQPGDSIGPKCVAQGCGGLPRIGVRIDACAADSDQIRQRVQIDCQW
jgi:hypothetical protein